MIEMIRLKAHVGDDGLLKLELPVGASNVDCEVTITVRPKMTQAEWEAFLERTAGSLADHPVERGEQPPLEIRDELE